MTPPVAPVDQRPVAHLTALGKKSLNRSGIQIEGLRIDVAKGWPRTRAGNGAGGGKKRVGTGDDLVPGPDLERHQRQQQCVGAGGDAHAESALAVGGDILLELGDLGA